MKNFKFNVNSIISLWQNPNYLNILLNFYIIVNKYLNTGIINVSDIILDKIDMNKIEFEAFIIKYINSLNKILYKKPMESIILYRGEIRSEFDIKINDILLYKNFHSSTDSISFAFNFSKYSNLETDFSKIRLLLVLKIPNGFNYIKLNKPLINYNEKSKITDYYNEYEYLIPPNCYYQVTNVVKLANNVRLVKAILIKQEKYIIPEIKAYNGDLTENKVKNNFYIPTQPSLKNLNDFKDLHTNNFISQFYEYYKYLEILDNLKDYHIPNILFKMLSNPLYSNFFNLNISIILEYGNKINDDNFFYIMHTLKQLGFPYKKKDLIKPQIYIKTLKALANSNISSLNYINNMKVFYSEYNNISNEKPKFIKLLDEKPEGIYKYILECSVIPECNYYDCVINDIYPNLTLEKNNKKTLIYIKYIVEFELNNIKIAISDESKNMFIDKVLLIPNFTYKVISKVKSKNKFNKEIIIYKIILEE